MSPPPSRRLAQALLVAVCLTALAIVRRSTSWVVAGYVAGVALVVLGVVLVVLARPGPLRRAAHVRRWRTNQGLPTSRRRELRASCPDLPLLPPRRRELIAMTTAATSSSSSTILTAPPGVDLDDAAAAEFHAHLEEESAQDALTVGLAPRPYARHAEPELSAAQQWLAQLAEVVAANMSTIGRGRLSDRNAAAFLDAMLGYLHRVDQALEERGGSTSLDDLLPLVRSGQLGFAL
jgi:hypothetical protein